MAQRTQLQVLADLAEHRSHAAARNLALLNSQGERSEEKLRLLEAYLQEYRARLEESVREGLDGERLRNYLAFISRVERAIAEQSAEVDKDKARIEQGKQRWQEEERQRKTFETLIERRSREIKLARARREQSQNDEFAARTVVRLNAAGRRS